MHEDDPLALLREMAAKKVLVEIALSSNDLILGVKGNRHPLRTYLQYGVPVALATDDSGVARSSHTLEWVKGRRGAGARLPTIKRMVRNSIDYAFVDAADENTPEARPRERVPSVRAAASRRRRRGDRQPLSTSPTRCSPPIWTP